jgi:hypothetical protein
MKRCLVFFLLLMVGHPANASEENLPPKFMETIEDNSILVEEAYNQEPGVVQHIFNVLYFLRFPHDVQFSFTQEWPVLSQKNQLSYTLPAVFQDGGSNGLGDILLNYRYQLFGQNDWAWVAPRLSILFPTGNNDKGTGFGTTGVQINFPVSKRWTNHFITHFNVGGTFLPEVKQTLSTGASSKRTLLFANVGVSLGWLATKHFNFMLEYTTNFNSEIDDLGNIRRFNQFTVNPFLRGSIDVGKLQIVPGIGIPLTWSDGDFQPGIFFYLSFEHPFMKTKE